MEGPSHLLHDGCGAMQVSLLQQQIVTFVEGSPR